MSILSLLLSDRERGSAKIETEKRLWSSAAERHYQFRQEDMKKMAAAGLFLFLGIACIWWVTADGGGAFKNYFGYVILLPEKEIALNLRLIDTKDLFLDLEYGAPVPIRKPRIVFNGEALAAFSSRKIRFTQVDYFRKLREGITKSDSFVIPKELLRLDENTMRIAFDGLYPAELAMTMKNFAFRSSSQGITVTRNEVRGTAPHLQPVAAVLFAGLLVATLFYSCARLPSLLRVAPGEIRAVSFVFVALACVLIAAVRVFTAVTPWQISLNALYVVRACVFLLLCIALTSALKKFLRESFAGARAGMRGQAFFLFCWCVLLSGGLLLIDCAGPARAIACCADIMLVGVVIGFAREGVPKAP